MKLKHQPNRERGFFATVIMVAILALMVIFVAANAKRLYQLDRELKLVEQQQVKKFSAPAATNDVGTAISSFNAAQLRTNQPTPAPSQEGSDGARSPHEPR